MSDDPKRWERIARRLLVLGDWGLPTDLMSGHVEQEGFLSDEWLTDWYGHRFAEDTAVIEALHKADERCR